MPVYRVLVSRTRTINEHIVVSVNSSSKEYADRDATDAVARLDADDWCEDSHKKSPLSFDNIKEIV